MTKSILKVLLAISVLGHSSVCPAQPTPGWSFWGTADGMKESYTSSVAVHADSVWVKHGSVNRMNLLDGYAVAEIPDPGATGRIRTSPDGTLWIWSGQRLARYRNSRWEAFDVEAVTHSGFLRGVDQDWIFTPSRSPNRQTPIWIVGVDADHALILLPDQILEFEALEKTTRTVLSSQATSLGSFTSMRRESMSTIWVTGQRGLGGLSSPDLKWRELVKPPSGFGDFQEPYEGKDGEVFVRAMEESSTPVVLRLDSAQWQCVYRGESRDLKGWRGEEKTIWIQDGHRLLHLSAAGKSIPVERTGPLSGVVLSIQPEPDNRFWVSTTQGLAMYVPPIWRTPPETRSIDDVVNAITEDKQGRVWFLSPHSLVCLDGERWEFFTLPKYETPWALHGEGLALLPDDNIAIRTTSPDLLTFDPKRSQFRSVKHPAGRDIRLFIPQPGGSLLVQTASRGSPGNIALETFDGQDFHPLLNPGTSWGIGDLRSVVVGDKGEIWAGGSDGFGVYRNGSFSRIDASTGFADTGAFCITQVADGKLLAGGRDGLYEYDGHAWRGILHGLDRVRSIVTTRDGSVWIASGTGVHRLQNGARISHGIEEGLPSDVAYRVFEDSRGRIWAGTTRGLSLLHPDSDRDPPTTLISAEQNAREAPPGGRVRLVFSGLDKWKVTPADRLLFSWRIDDGHWSTFSSGTSAAIDKLRPGDHTFEVRAMDRNGNIDPHPPAYRFSVLPSWYQTASFRYLAGASALMIGLLLVFAVSNYRLLSRKKKLERDRQDILEMIARRETLESILQRIVLAIAENQQGAIGAALQHGNGTLQFLAFRDPPIKIAYGRGFWTVRKDGLLRDFAYVGLSHGSTIQIRSAKQEILGALVAIFPGRARQKDGDLATLEALGGIASLAIENTRLYDQLDHHAHHDILTGLPNRWSAESELQTALRKARDNGQSLALLFLDVDRFKHVNDSLGHSGGDTVLKHVAARLIQSIPNDAMAARTGGDEFTVIIKDIEKPDVEQAVLRMLDAIRSPLNIDGNELYPSVSIGIGMFPQDGGDAVTLQRHADLAMYRAKSRRKNGYEFFSEDIGDSAAKALAMEQVLRKALDENWLELYYQAQFNQSGEVAGIEALVRLHHPLVGLVGPADFISVAEETGLIHRLGEWVLREVCRQIRRWQDAGLEPVKIAVNVSALQFHQPSFAESVGHILNEMQTDPRLIELELTESMIMSDYQESARQMQKLRQLGVSLAVDDFGTGYSSLAHLHRLPIDVLKIDQSFIREIDSRLSTWPLVQAIVVLAHNLNLTVVAEGVETASHRSALEGIDCDGLQGYGLHRPQPAAQIEEILLTNTSARISFRIAG